MCYTRYLIKMNSVEKPNPPSVEVPLSFDNTKIAFQNKTDGELKQAYWLFKMIGSNFLVKTGSPLLNFALNIGLPIKGIIRNTIFRHFCGGEDIVDCNEAVARLSVAGVGTILDYSVEGGDSEDAFDTTCTEILRVIERTAQSTDIPFAVFKVTGLGRFSLLEKISAKETLSPAEEKEYQAIKDRVEKICSKSYEKGVRILIDAEHSWIQNFIDELALEYMSRFNREKVLIYNTYQLYRHDKLEDLKADFAKAEAGGFRIGAKLVRGAYMEIERARAAEKGYPSPINPTKEASDQEYNGGVRFCLDHIDKIGLMVGSHNEDSCRMTAELMASKGIAKDNTHVYFAQLLGMSDNLSFNLANAGYNVAKYMPYGPIKAVMPYLMRRAQENTSVAGQTGRELNLIQKEVKRRNL